MATRALEAAYADRNRTYYPNAKHPDEVDPSDCSGIYASRASGTCLEPVFKDGTCFAFSSVERYRAGDYVGFWLHPDIPHAHELPRRIKRLKSAIPRNVTFPYRPRWKGDLGPIIELEQFNPPRVLRVPAAHIVGMHKMIGTAVDDGDGMARFYPLESDAKVTAA